MKRKYQTVSTLFIIYTVIVFISLFIFLTVINPLVVYDTDDWLYIGQFRRPIPMIGHWNPIKVFPETFMPLVSYFGVFVINPIIHNYCYSLTLAHGLFSSVVLTIYFAEFSFLFYKKKLSSLPLSIGYGITFILLHFITYIHSGNNNIFLIWSRDLTCFYNYTLPAVLNASLVMHIMSYGNLQILVKKSSVPHKIGLLIWLYFAIFSNLFSSVILAAYIGADLLYQLITAIKEKEFKLQKYCLGNITNLLIIAVWLFSNYMETTGGRADDIGKNTLANIPITILYSLVNVVALNGFITIFIILVGSLWAKKCGRFNTAVYKSALYFVLTISYLIITSATAEPDYIYRPEVAIDFLFYLFLLVIACFNELISQNRKYIRLLLVMAATMILLLIHPGKIYFSYNNSNISYNQCEALINDIIDQFTAAEADGSGEVVLEVPVYDVIYNWPLADFAGDNIATALYNHKITNSLVTVKEIVPTEKKNTQFNISRYDLEKNLKKPYLIFR